MMSIEGAAKSKQLSVLENVLKQVPASHAATVRVVVNMLRELGEKGDLNHVCLLVGPLLIRSKKPDEDKEVRLKQARVAGQVRKDF